MLFQEKIYFRPERIKGHKKNIFFLSLLLKVKLLVQTYKQLFSLVALSVRKTFLINFSMSIKSSLSLGNIFLFEVIPTKYFHNKKTGIGIKNTTFNAKLHCEKKRLRMSTLTFDKTDLEKILVLFDIKNIYNIPLDEN